MKTKTYMWILTAVLLSVGCKKFVEVGPPPTALGGSTIYDENSTAAGAVSGIYLTMTTDCIGGGRIGISALCGVSADEFKLYANSSVVVVSQAYVNALQSTSAPAVWSDLYNVIYQANLAISGISASSGVTIAMKNQLIGECEVVRSFCYFYLVNIYGDVPLITTPNYVVNQAVSRTPAATVYQQMITDLKDAQIRLGNNYLGPDGSQTSERVRPNGATATALLARVYLYTDSLKNAENEATAVINNASYILDPNLNNVFASTSQEAIWQLELQNTGLNTADGSIFLLNKFGGPSGAHPFILGDSIALNFEAGDLRKANWVDSIVVSEKNIFFHINTNYTSPESLPLNILRFLDLENNT